MPTDEARPRAEGNVLPLPAAPDGVELRHLRSFVAVAEELNFGRAAARLYVSQPALSRQVRALERLLGCDLLRRSTHRVELTLAGEALLERARGLLHEVDDAVAATRAVGGEVEGRLAQVWAPLNQLMTTGPDLQAMRNLAEEMHARFPVPDVDVRPVNAGGTPSLVVEPTGGAPLTLLYAHGGGFAIGSAFGYRHLVGALAIAAGAGALAPEYRLAPEHPFPAGLEDMLRAYRWLIESGTAADEVVLAGDSAGASLVLSLMLSLRAEGTPLPGGAILFCPGIDLSFEEDMPATELSQAMSREQLQGFADAYLAGHPLDDPLVSPLLGDMTGFPPMLVQGGTGDVIVRDAHRLADHARNHGVDVRFELYPVDTHDFQVFWSFLPEAADAVTAAGRFCRELRGERPDAAASGSAAGA